jgi:hypothetical protein
MEPSQARYQEAGAPAMGRITAGAETLRTDRVLGTASLCRPLRSVDLDGRLIPTLSEAPGSGDAVAGELPSSPHLDGSRCQRRDVRAGNVHFAGEHLSDEYFGFMNGAAQMAAWLREQFCAVTSSDESGLR